MVAVGAELKRGPRKTGGNFHEQTRFSALIGLVPVTDASGATINLGSAALKFLENKACAVIFSPRGPAIDATKDVLANGPKFVKSQSLFDWLDSRASMSRQKRSASVAVQLGQS